MMIYPKPFNHTRFNNTSTHYHNIWRRMWILLVISLLGLASAQIEATVDRTDLTTDDTLQLTVTVTGPGSTRPPEMAALGEFNVLRTNISTNISIVNGNMQSQVVYQYLLQPQQVGTLTIPPVSVTLQGQDYQTNPITITVREGTGATTTTTDASFFVEAEVDTTTPFVGAQVLYTFRFFQAERFSGSVDYDAPDVAGFWEGSRPEQRQYQVSHGGRRYNVTELQSALFPTRAGELTIGPAVLTMAPNLMAAQRSLETQPITLNVVPLPEPAPADFTGAVGQFAISAFEQSQTATQGEPVQVEVFVSGSSNIDTLPEPTVPILPEWRVQLGEVESDSRLRDSQLSGTKVFRYSLIPETFGRLTIPPFRYSYFDPDAAMYRAIETQPIELLVNANPQALAAASTATPASTPEDAPVEDVPTTEDVSAGLALRARAGSSNRQRPLTWVFWGLWGFSPGLVIAAWSWQARQAYLSKDATRLRFMNAYKNAVHHVDTPENTPMQRVLMTYLEDKLATPLRGGVKETLATLLPAYGASNILTQKVIRYFESLDEMRYAARQQTDTTDDGRMLLEQLEKELKWQPNV